MTEEIQTKEDLLKAIGESMLWVGKSGCITRYMAEAGVDRVQAEQGWEEMRDVLAQLFSTEELVADDGFDANLKLLYGHFGGKMGRLFYEARLREFFPEEIVQALTVEVYSEVTEKFEQFARVFLLQRAGTFLVPRPSQSVLVSTSRSQGTKTWFVSCPNCGTEKRVDHRTKRFRCKQCDFDQPFPFPE